MDIQQRLWLCHAGSNGSVMSGADAQGAGMSGADAHGMGMRRILRWLVAGVFGLLAAGGMAVAAFFMLGSTAGASSPTVCTWTNSSGNAEWSYPTNWNCGSGTSNGPPAVGDAVVFPATIPSGSSSKAPYLDESTPTLASITFDNGYNLGITSSATTLTLDPSYYGVSGNVAISAYNSNPAEIVNDSSTPGTSGSIYINGNATIEAASGLILDVPLTGGSSSDTLTFGNASGGFGGSIEFLWPSTYADGSTSVVSGTLTNDIINSLPSSTSLQVGAASYELNGWSQTLAGLTGTSGTVDSNAGSPTLTIDSPSTDTFAGDLTGSLSLDKAGSGTLTLSGTNAYTGDTTVSGGTLVAANGAALGGTASTAGSGGAVTVDSGATLQVGSTNSSVTLPNDLVLESGSTLATPTLSSYSSATDFSVSGTTTLNGGVSVYAGHDTNLYLEGQLTGTGSVTTTGPYTTWITDSSNNYSGGTTVAYTGTLVVEASGALGTGPVTDEGHAPILLDGSSISLANDFTISGGSYCDGGIICDGFSTFSPSVTAGADTLTGTIDLAGNADLGAASGGTLSLTGNIRGSSYGITTNGDVVLSATNSYTGTTSVSSGTLTVTNGSALGGDPSSAGSGGTVTVGSGATLQLASGSSNTSCLPSGMAAPSSFILPNDLVVDGTGTNGAAGIDNCEGTNTISGEVSLASNTVPVDVNCAASLSACQTTDSLTLSGPVSGFQGIELGNGAGGVNGMLVLTGTSAYTGTTSVTTGTLDVTGSIGSSAGVIVYGGSVLEGTGTVPAITTSSCSSSSPCIIYSGDAPGTLTSTGYANLSASGSTLQVDLASTSPGAYSQLVADGANISGTQLDITSVASAPYGTTYDILHNTSGSAVTGEFSYAGSPLTQGEIFSVDGRILQISYDGGASGHDVTLTDVTNPPPPPPAPSVTSIFPTSGPTSGGTTVTITGTDLSGAGYVFFGSTTATSFTVNSSTSITAVSPAGSAGTVNVTVTTPGGTSATNSADQFTYVTPSSPTPVSTFYPVTPTRICDTRPGNPSHLSGTALTQCEGNPIGSGKTLTIQVAGLSGIPSDATAVWLNVTTLGDTSPGYLDVYPVSTTRPTTSEVSITSAAPAATSLYVRLSSNGQVTIYNSSGTTQVIVDVEGYSAASTTTDPGSIYTPVIPTRICDTRPGNPSKLSGVALSQCEGKAPSANATLTIAVPGIPVTATAVALNLTATQAGGSGLGSGYLSIYPQGSTMQIASELNYSIAAGTVSNTVVVPVVDGEVTIYSSGISQIMVDLQGYFSTYIQPSGSSSSSASTSLTPGSIVSINPVRICDTRPGNPSNLSGTALSQCEGKTLAAGSTLTVSATGSDLPVPSGATAVIVSVTATDETSSGYLSLDPSSIPPDTSDLNWTVKPKADNGTTKSLDVTHLVIVPLSATGTFSIYAGIGNPAGSTDVTVDAVGYVG